MSFLMGEQMLYFIECFSTLLIITFVSVSIDFILKKIALVKQLNQIKIIGISKIRLGI